MNLFFGTRAEVPPALAEQLVSSGLTILAHGEATTTVGLVSRLEGWQPPVTPCNGLLLASPGGDRWPEKGTFLPRHDWERRCTPSLRATLAGHQLTALTEGPSLFLHWEPKPTSWELERAPWSLLVGYATARRTVLEQKKVRAALGAAGLVVGTYTGLEVFGRCVATFTRETPVQDVALEAQVPGIEAEVERFLSGAGQKLRTDTMRGVEAFLCFGVQDSGA